MIVEAMIEALVDARTTLTIFRNAITGEWVVTTLVGNVETRTRGATLVEALENHNCDGTRIVTRTFDGPSDVADHMEDM